MAFIMCVYTVCRYSLLLNKVCYGIPIDVDHILDGVHACIFEKLFRTSPHLAGMLSKCFSLLEPIQINLFLQT